MGFKHNIFSGLKRVPIWVHGVNAGMHMVHTWALAEFWCRHFAALVYTAMLYVNVGTWRLRRPRRGV